jgi:predicted ATP-grasp superfamily ATP-dependent carboligase
VGRRASGSGTLGRVPDDAERFPALEHLRWSRRPQLYAPVLLVAFGGWSDAGDAATTAVNFIGDAFDAHPFASIDPEHFYDFSSTRPLVQFNENDEREVTWPENTFGSARVVGTELDLITLTGIEPQLKWRTFCDQIIGVAKMFDAHRVLTFGALLAEVPHARPVSIFGVGHDTEASRQLDLLPSRYEGPTGITGVLQTAARDAGMQASSLWAAVPTYVPSAPSPKAALALVDRATRLLDIAVDTTELHKAAEEYENEVTELVDDDEETSEYVHQLEERYDADEPRLFAEDAPRLVEEVERFLRDQD